MASIGVIGGGAWGTALAQVQAAQGRATMIWAREAEVVEAINNQHENSVFLPDVPLDPSLKASGDARDVIDFADILLFVTPAQYLRSGLEAMKDFIRADLPIVICSKGIEIETGSLLVSAARDVLGEDHPIAVLTGPTFASDIARGLPAAVTIAAQDEGVRESLVEALGSKTFRPYPCADLVGAQLGSAIKNVIAIAAGVASGLKLGDSARAALITRGLAEMARLTKALGGDEATLMEMCGLGDLVLTCSSMQSRNCSLGFALGEGRSLEDVLGERRSVTEGVHTAKAVCKLADSLDVEMPICRAVLDLVEGRADVRGVIDDLLSRPFVC